jgi:hypothetical protein
MNKLAATLAVALLAATFGVGLASPASAGGTTIDVSPTSGPVGTTVQVEGFCGYIPGDYEMAFLGEGRFAWADVGGEVAPGDAGPYEFEFQIPATLDQGPGAPQEVVPGIYEFGIECDDFEVEAYVEFEVTPSPTTTTTSTTTVEPTSTTQAQVAPAIALEPSFTG